MSGPKVYAVSWWWQRRRCLSQSSASLLQTSKRPRGQARSRGQLPMGMWWILPRFQWRTAQIVMKKLITSELIVRQWLIRMGSNFHRFFLGTYATKWYQKLKSVIYPLMRYLVASQAIISVHVLESTYTSTFQIATSSTLICISAGLQCYHLQADINRNCNRFFSVFQNDLCLVMSCIQKCQKLTSKHYMEKIPLCYTHNLDQEFLV